MNVWRGSPAGLSLPPDPRDEAFASRYARQAAARLAPAALHDHLRGRHASRRKIMVFLLAVPTGIVTSELTAQQMTRPPTTRTCQECPAEGLAAEARFCMHCGAKLPQYATDAATPPPSRAGVRTGPNCRNVGIAPGSP
jgi:hypothetical protein